MIAYWTRDGAIRALVAKMAFTLPQAEEILAKADNDHKGTFTLKETEVAFIDELSYTVHTRPMSAHDANEYLQDMTGETWAKCANALFQAKYTQYVEFFGYTVTTDIRRMRPETAQFVIYPGK